MPNGEELEKKAAEWQKQATTYFELFQRNQELVDRYGKDIVELTKSPIPMPSWMPEPIAKYLKYAIMPIAAPVIATETMQKWDISKIKPKLILAENEAFRDLFYAKLYSEVPEAILLGQVQSPEDVLSKMPEELVNTLSPEEIGNVKDIISGMVSTITGVKPLPEMAVGAEFPELPELVAPTEIALPKIPLINISKLTTQEIVKTLIRPRETLPLPILTDEEWKEYLSTRQGDVDDPEVDYLESKATSLVDEWKELDNQLKAYKEALAEMPDYELTDLLKDIVVQPGLALMEVAGYYFEHVSQPLAGAVWKGLIPDLERKYQEYRRTESTWKALSHAWVEWDSPGEGAWEFILKYIIMEAPFDPLTYVGWGIATRITKPLGAFGRLVGGAETALAKTMELPFDLIKAGLRRLPKTLTQRAALQQAKAIQYVDKWVTKYTGKSIDDLSKMPDGMVRFSQATERAIRAASLFPQSQSDIVRAGKELLKHTPIDESMVLDMHNRLMEVAQKPGLLTKESVSKELVDNIDNLFEDYFTRGRPGHQKLTLGEAARELLVRLNIDNTDDTWKLAQRILDDRADRIVREALVIGQARTPVRAIYALGRRNFRYYIRTEESVVYLARKQAAAFHNFLAGVESRAIQVWRNSIDRWVVRPFAEAYLAFALYGPMNILEDIIRSTLGGVKPARVNRARFSRKWVGVGYDPQLKRDAMSETLGELRRGSEAMRTNWIMSIGGLAKGLGEKTYGVLVEKPGQIGIDFRRGFVDGRATQILKEMGGDTFEKLVKLDVPKPKLRSKKLIKEVYEAVNDLKLSGDPDSIRYARELFTQEAIHRREVNQILMEHPDMPRAVRDKLIKDMDDNILMNNPEQITERIGESRDILLDDFIRSPDRASEQMKQLADMLTDLEIRNPEEMAQVMYSLNYMAQVQGAVPKQVMRRATQRTRGLPFEERMASINADTDRLSLFLEKSKDEMQRVADKIKAELPNISKELQPAYDRYYDTLMAKSINASDNRMADIARRREYFARATKENLKDVDFWEHFYLETDDFWNRFDLEQLEFDDLLQSVAREMGEVQGVKYPTRPAIKITDRALAPQDIAQVLGVRMDDVTKSLMESMMLRQDRPRFVKYVMHHVGPDDVGFTEESVGRAYDQIIHSLQLDPATMDWMKPRLMELEDVNRQLHGLYNSKLLPEEEITEIGRYVDNIADQVDELVYGKAKPRIIETTTEGAAGQALRLQQEGFTGFGRYRTEAAALKAARGVGKSAEEVTLVKSRGMFDLYHTGKPSKPLPPVGKPTVTSEFKDYNQMRQTAMDEAQKWYYKEFTDYTNANAFDAIMKSIYPYWTYESQRWFWLPRSFVRHPVVFTTFERWQNNTDYGYVHIPGIPIDWNPFRGTVFGTLTTRLARRDFPEYYDSFGVAGDFIEFSDFLSRYGFYPGAHIGVPLAVFGGVEMQFGEVMPALPKTGLDFMLALFPDNESVRFITDRIFGDRFRNYLTILQVNRRGGDGTLIFSKMQENKELTEEEQQYWDDSRREVGWYSAGFEQFAMFRMRTDEQYKMYEESAKVIEEMTGYTPDQQDWLRKHGHRLWDMVGGMSPTQQAVLQELDYYKWIGNVRPLLPGRQQEILNQIELAWNDVRNYSESTLDEKSRLQRDFLAGRIGPEDYSDSLTSIYSKQRAYVDQKIEENPLMDLDNRAEYYKKYNIPQPVLHPMRELLNLYFEIELEDKIDEETGEKVKDWDKFWAMRDAIESAVPDEYRQEWDDYLARNSTALEQLRREHNKYVKPYNAVWERILEEYTPEEQKLIKEHQYLVKTGTGLERRAIIEDTIREATGRKLISNFRSDISNARQALRYANPWLDAVLYYWGRTTTFQTPQAEETYKQLARDTGKKV